MDVGLVAAVKASILAVTLLLALISLINAIAFVASGRPTPRPQDRPRGPDEVEFVVVSKASREVLEVLLDTIKRIRRMFPAYRLWVVVDEGSEGLGTLSGLAGLHGFRLVVVPRWYDRGKYKARALNYFIENYVKDGEWYVFLDDDSYPLDSRFLYELRDEIPVYNGILAPRRGSSLLAWLADAVRYYGDVSRMRLALRILGKPIYGLHGELLIAKGWALRRIGFDTDSVSEDTWFAAQAIKAGVKVGQVSTRVSILSPHSVRDLMVQRSRWLLGRLRDFLRGEYPRTMALAYALELSLIPMLPVLHVLILAKVAYGIEFTGTLALIEYSLKYLGLPLLVLAYTLYHIAERRDPVMTLIAIIAIPILTLIEAHSVTYALLNYRRLWGRFIVINKAEEPAELLATVAPRERLIVQALTQAQGGARIYGGTPTIAVA